MLFRTQIIFCSSELRLHFRIAEVGSLLSLNRAWRAQVPEVGSLLSLNRAWRAQVTFGTSVVGLNFFFIS